MVSPSSSSLRDLQAEIRSDILSAKTRTMTSIHQGQVPLTEVGGIPIQFLDMANLPGVPSSNCMTASKVYKPFTHDFGYEFWRRQNQVHWLEDEIQLGDDVADWSSTITLEEETAQNLVLDDYTTRVNAGEFIEEHPVIKMTESHREALRHVFRLFTQNDMLVMNAYIDKYAKIFRNNQLQMTFAAFANMEAIHQVAYSYLLDTIGLPTEEYSAFLDYKEMIDKYDYTAGFEMDTLTGIAVALFMFGGMAEGVQLFATFAVLMNFQRFNLMKGMGQIVALSVRDESLHCQFVGTLFRQFLAEFGHLIDLPRMWAAIEHGVRKTVEFEKIFTDLIFKMGPLPGITKETHYNYIESIADMRCRQFGAPSLFGDKSTPYPWIDNLMTGVEHANIFEQRSSGYAKGATRGTWQETWDHYDTTAKGRFAAMNFDPVN